MYRNMSDADPRYLDPDLPVEERVSDLLDRMTIEEKVGQLVGTFLGDMGETENSLEDVVEAVEEYNIGSVAPFGWGGAFYNEIDECIDVAQRLQEHAREETRLGIPLLFTSDAIHGHAYVKGATVFPNNLGIAATWDPDLVERSAEITSAELQATGVKQNYGPTCDVARDPRWGRTGETLGESPYLVGELAARKVRAYQGDGLGEDTVAATAKHFPAYGEPSGGEDTAVVDVSEHTLEEIFLPPFERAIEEGVATVMPCYNSVDGEPVHGSRRFLTELLRDELDFEGFVASDWDGIHMLDEKHLTTRSPEMSVWQVRQAGLDVASIGGPAHADHLLELVESGKLDEAVVDRSVRRVLRAKFELGLFESSAPDRETARETLGREEHRQAARETVRESLTLLQNDDDLLPLGDDVDEVFVTGPNADDLVNQLGGWSAPTEDNLPGTTILEGLRDVAGDDASVTYERGSGLNETEDVDAAADRAAEADVVVAALGEGWYIHEFGPTDWSGVETGDFPTRGQLSLPDAQRELIEAVTESDTPLVAVLVTGRPLAVEWLAERADSLLMAYYPGTDGGQVVAETLFGESEPGGRLPISVPRSAADLPSRFNHYPHPHPIGSSEHPDTYDPLFEFGHGLSYTTIEYRSVEPAAETVTPGDSVDVTVTLENTGDRRGSEVVQAYLQDRHSDAVTPVRELAAFERVELEPGERREVTVTVTPERRGGDHPFADGAYDLYVGDQEFELEVAKAEAEVTEA